MQGQEPQDVTQMEEYLQAEHFKPHVGKVFKFKGTRFAIPLDHISTTKQKLPKGVKRRPFLLIFRAPREREYMPEGMYECEVEGGPTFSFYIAPIQTYAREFQDYQAAFN